METENKSEKPKIKCYAAALGNCSSKVSREHYVSKGLFTGPSIMLEGQPWLDGGKKELPLNAIGLKILCTTHNSKLSKLDAAAKEFSLQLGTAMAITDKRGKLPRSSFWRKDTQFIDGLSLERWMAKSSVGAMFEGKTFTWHPNNTLPFEPPKYLVEVVFSLAQFQYPMGLYLIHALGDKIEHQERVNHIPLLHKDTNGYVGSMVNFWNFQFLIWLCDEELVTGRFLSPTGARFSPSDNVPVYHPQRLDFNAKGKLSSSIHLDWNNN